MLAVLSSISDHQERTIIFKTFATMKRQFV
jgi:hypothetical protein